MSKGDRHRSINPEFKNNFDNIKWSGKTKYANVKRAGNKRQAHHIMPDIEPYTTVGGVNPGEVITSRSKHREYLKRSNAIEVGNEKDYFFKYNGKTPNNPTKDW
jgi:hypothetical protein